MLMHLQISSGSTPSHSDSRNHLPHPTSSPWAEISLVEMLIREFPNGLSELGGHLAAEGDGLLYGEIVGVTAMTGTLPHVADGLMQFTVYIVG